MFSITVFFLRSYMAILKMVVWILPFKWPQTFEGPDSSLKLCQHIAAQGHKQVLLVTDSMLSKLGLLNPMQAELERLGVQCVVYDGVEPDPTVQQIEAGVDLLKQHDADSVLAVGGGSSIDAAKIIAARATNTRSVLQMVGILKIKKPLLPLYAVPTTAGTGSEVTGAAVVSDPEAQRKLPVADTKLLPLAVALDSALMTGLPPHITAATGMDVLTHAIEAYLSINATAATDKEALLAAKLAFENLPKVYADGQNLEARQHMTVASNRAGIAITQAGVGYVHAIAHNFGALYHTPHGLANAIAMPHVLEFSKPKCAKRMAEIARECGLASRAGSVESDEQLANALIQRIRELKQQFDIPETLPALKSNDIPRIAKAALEEARFTYAVPRYMQKADCEALVAKMLPAAA